MNTERENIIVYGLGITGKSAVKTLSKLGGFNVFIYDEKEYEKIEKELEELKDFKFSFLTQEDFDSFNFKYCVKSPGIHLENKFLKKCGEKQIEIITDIELCYLLWPNRKYLAITGTNGKTTTTTLVGEIIKQSGKNCVVAGNIGVGLLWEVFNSEEDAYIVIECSSFQLENINKFKPHICAIINLTPDHKDWHKTVENYYNAKKKIAKNQNNEDYIILNYNSKELVDFSKSVNSKVVFISTREKVKNGIYIENGYIKSELRGYVEELFPISNIKLVERHNFENVLVAVGICLTSGIDVKSIVYTCENFQGVSHRIEFVREIKGVKYYNDSKGTNVDASIKAIEAFDKPIILIAGGYDKKVPLDDLFVSFSGNVKALILLGETKNIFYETAVKHGFKNNYIVDDMEEAVSKAYELSQFDDIVLLSPASASWDMYDNYEVRGNHFKELVNKL